MLFGSVGAFTIGLISLSFTISVAGTNGVFNDRCLSSLKARGYVSETSANVITNEATPLYCDYFPTFMKIELSEELKNMREDFSNGWNYYTTVPKGDEWYYTHLTYSVHEYRGFSEEKIDTVLRTALSLWSDAAPALSFKQVQKDHHASMKLEIARYNEGKQIPSAICKLYPQLEYATLHLIGDKMDLRSDLGMNAAICLAAHAFGHALGLGHSDESNAIMSPNVECYGRRYVVLHPDDRKGIRYLYPDDGGARGTGKDSSSSSSSYTETETETEEEDRGKTKYMYDEEELLNYREGKKYR